jgi:hypothetical protein
MRNNDPEFMGINSMRQAVCPVNQPANKQVKQAVLATGCSQWGLRGCTAIVINNAWKAGCFVVYFAL